mmetsp:Transcript_11033/g.24323  ORF Transcript_11033/g.24323 Transcript_11033/m.24323 type:complete len:267 (-) Transcript_11033:316-1116(-)|eukprot:CAMPEP_0113297414 /NCGR_PEP_ID=MMETSP0010_2-20120614/289_1 /TAXON_ID=216773 ORGANISM="Corethron hystrix, Strain 308" /NCGR_SAMPLE_ID=MMETSP0010_2 /ASSEMBLY_ACC=CAM_ASM_000155 /LENGTH=266 /DNA_ID=CAMNT_0000150305 /DNA_START=192 /DNA_END=992 /DNA_ORIENTATION=- /assembly_acc=CAM_ASM_000155
MSASTASPPDFVSTIELLQSYSNRLHSLDPIPLPYDVSTSASKPGESTATTTTLRSKIRSSHINLTRARRSKSSGALILDSADTICASNIREEFDASVRVLPVTDKTGNFVGWKLVDRLNLAKDEGTCDGEDLLNAVQKGLKDCGLRRRHTKNETPKVLGEENKSHNYEDKDLDGEKKGDLPSTETSWEVIDERLIESVAEEKYNIDPIYMLDGMPSKPLRTAQTMMREVLAEIVEYVASDAVGVTRGLNEMDKSIKFDKESQLIN